MSDRIKGVKGSSTKYALVKSWLKAHGAVDTADFDDDYYKNDSYVFFVVFEHVHYTSTGSLICALLDIEYVIDENHSSDRMWWYD